MSADSVYFAAKSSKETVSVLMSRAEYWTNNLEANGYLDKLRMAWAAYHGAYYSDVSTGHQVTFGGTQGELAQLPVNHIRNLAEHIIVMITANRPTMEARATNSDYKSLVQTNLANGLLDYYMREKRMEKYLKRAVEYAVVLGAGFIKMNWNATTGPLYDINEDTNSPIYEGDAEFTNLSPFDVIMDSTKEDQNHDWLTCRTWKNRFDLAAKYPELADKIIKMPTKSETIKFRFSGLCQDETDDVAIYEFYHKRTECLPDGRYILFLSDDIVLYDGPLPYRTIPVFRISPSDILGTPYGYTSLFDLLPLQEALNAMYSAVLSNNNAFAVQNILVPRGADISVQELVGGLNIIEANLQAGKPEALNLCKTAPETYSFMKTLEQQMETLSGINSVARGNPEASLKSGTALALVQSMAIQFMSGLQQSYVELIEDVGTGLINMLRDFAAVPRVAAIVGRSHRAEMKEFNGNDLNNINRVIVDVGNPLSRTTAGRVQMAEQLLQMKAITDPAQYFTVINTGRLDVMDEGEQAEVLLIRDENEKMLSGQSVPVIGIDEHKKHIIEHRSLLADTDLRSDANLTKLVLDHIQAHINALKTTDPALLQLIGEQPLPPPAPPGPPPGMPQGGPPPMAQGSNQQRPPMPPPGPIGQQPPIAGAPMPPIPPQPIMQQMAPGMRNAGMPRLPTVNPALLPNPQLQEALMHNLKKQ